MKILIVFFLIFFPAAGLFCQSPEETTIPYTGVLSIDLKNVGLNETINNSPQFSYPVNDKKSPFLAGLLSAVLPGAGEFYSESYIKAAVFAVMEAGLITVGIIYDNKGDEKTEEFEEFGRENWSVLKYAQWLIQHKGADPGIIKNPDPSLPPSEQVNWNLLNQFERQNFSHTLPRYGEQQYYELIGKYFQFSSGWNDYDINNPNNSEESPNFFFYSEMRGEANDLYNIASKAVIGIYINHFLSALDAVWSAILYNDEIALNLRVNQINFAGRNEFIPTVYISYSF